MEAQEAIVLVFGIALFVGGLVYLAGLLRETEGHRGASLVAVLAVAACGIALGLADREVWPLFVLCFPSTASVVVEALQHL